jgi:hypothetical protein
MITAVFPREKALLRVDNLKVHLPTEHGVVRAVDGVTFNLNRGKTTYKVKNVPTAPCPHAFITWML